MTMRLPRCSRGGVGKAEVTALVTVFVCVCLCVCVWLWLWLWLWLLCVMCDVLVVSQHPDGECTSAVTTGWGVHCHARG